MSPGIYTTSDVARMLRLSMSTIHKNCDSGALKCFKVPNSTHRRITRKAVEEFAREYGLTIYELEEAHVED